jgi:heme O synthase-like polyprenyltransferase
MMILLEGNYDGILYLILAIMFGPAILLAAIGFILSKNNKKAAKVFYILATVYVVISLGLCGSMFL